MKYRKILYNQLKNNIEPDCEDFYLCEIEEKAKKYDELIDYLKEQIKQCDKDIKRFNHSYQYKLNSFNDILSKYKEIIGGKDE